MSCGGSLIVEQTLPAFDGGANPTPPLHKKQWWVQTVPLATVQQLVAQYHYAKGGSNTAVFRHGLFRRTHPDTCLGAAWWIPPTKSSAMATYHVNWKAVLSLSRLVIVPDVPKNAASFLLMRSVAEIRKDTRWQCLVTYADEWQGHTGGIYKAAGWKYVGKTKPERVYVDASGRMVARKAGPKTRRHQEMVDLGCRCLGSFSKHKYVLQLI
jgi:hypothetical protein